MASRSRRHARIPSAPVRYAGRPTGPRAQRRRLPLLIAVVVAVGFAGTACVAADVPEVSADDAQLVEGRELWASNCVNCHGADGRGGVGRQLNDGALLELYPDISDQRMIVEEGKGAMPAFGPKFSEAELEAVVRYTREIIAEGS